MKKALLILLPVMIFLSVMAATYSYFRSDIQKWALRELEAFSDRNLPVKITARGFEVHFLSPSISLTDIRLTPKNPKEMGFDELTVKEARANLDFLQVLGGRIYLSSLVLEQGHLSLDLDPLLKDQGAPEELPLRLVFENLKKVPLFRMAVVRTHVDMHSEKLKLKISLNDLDLIAFNQRNKLNIKSDLSDSVVQFEDLASIPFAVRTDMTLNPSTLEVSQFDLNAFHSELHAQASLNNIKDVLSDPQGVVHVQGEVVLARLRELFKNPKKVIPFQGNLTTEGHVKLEKGHHYQGEFQIKGQKAQVDHFDIGDFEIKGDFQDDVLHLSDVAIHHGSGDLAVKNLEARFQSLKQVSVKAQIDTEQLDLHEMLLRLGVGDLPLEIFVSGHFNCDGPVWPQPNMTCQGSTHGEQLEVRNGPSVDHTIAAIDDFHATGEIKITDSAVSYKADLKVNDDVGTSDGVIGFKTGFKINYSTPLLHFKNIRNLANLKLEGAGAIQGQTSGDSSRGVFTINLDGHQIYFEDFFLGDAKTNIKYSKGLLAFDNISGQLNTTRYSAAVAVDLSEKQIKAEGQSPAMELNDVLGAFQRKVTLPVQVSGFGSVFVKLSGPLQFNQMTYNLSAQAFRGRIAGESYDHLQVDISSLKGEVKADKVFLVKNKSVISLFGKGHPNGLIDLTVRGENFLMEESENISKLGSSISGAFNFQMGLVGPVLSPDIQFRGTVSNMVIEEQEFANSTVNLNLSKTGLDGSAMLLGTRLKTEFTLPLDGKSPFRLKAQANDWNFATLFALIGGAGLLNDYETGLTGSIDISSETGGIFKATGGGRIERFLLKRGNLSLTNPQTMELTMKNGAISLSKFRLVGDQTFVEVRGQQFTSDDLRIQLEGDANLRLFHIFVPFMEEFGGRSKITASVTGPLTKPEMLGSATTDNAFVKIKGFPHPFERINASVQFSASKILINQFSGNLAGGSFKGDGVIGIEGVRELPTNITIRVENSNLNVPEGVHTLGDADLSFSGNWFPFLLSGTYRVKSGLIDKEFSDQTSNGTLKQSSYLPKVILQGAFEPIILDIQVQMDKGISIRNSILQGVLNGQLQVKGRPNDPLLFGKISASQTSKLLFKDKVFDISVGNIIFRDPAEIDPELYFSARSRVAEYDVSLLVQGTGKAPQLRLTSVPPLSEPDIISLLALGVVTGKSDQTFRNQNLNDNQTLGATIGSAVISNTKIGKKAQETLGVNVQLSSSYDDTKNVAVQRITLSKKIRDNVNVSASRIKGQQNSNEYRVRYNFSSKVSVVGTYEEREPSEDTRSTDTLRKNENIFGLDLEYQREFK